MRRWKTFLSRIPDQSGAVTDSDKDGVLAVARGFNASIFLACGLALVIAAGFGLFSDLKNLITTGLALLCMAGLQVFLVRGWVRSTSVAVLSLLFAGIFLSMVRFGSISIAQASLAGIPLIYCVVVLGETAGTVMLLISVAASAGITWAQLHGWLANASPTVPAAQWVVMTAGFFVAYRMAILFKRNLLDVNRRINATQTLLLEERERSAAQVSLALAELKRQKYVIDQHAIVITTDLSGAILYGNDKFVEVSGYTAEEFIGRNPRLLHSGYHPAGFFGAMYETIGRGEVWRGEICNHTKDGRVFWLAATVAALMHEDGTPREYVAVCTDITVRRAAQEAAHAASIAKSEFLANMSHEIRTPMNGVVGMVDVLKQTSLNKVQQRMVDTIQDSSLALLHILNDILDYSKVEAGKLAVERIPTPLVDVAQGVVQLMMLTAKAKSVELSVVASPDLAPSIYSDPLRLRQVLLNLVGNALKFTASDDLRRGRVVLHMQPSVLANGQPAVQLSVMDNGVGMDEEIMSKLFSPFTQADESTARRYGGTGLGLSICQRLVVLMGGTISAHSVLGQGSEFTVELPAYESPPGDSHVPDSYLYESGMSGVYRPGIASPVAQVESSQSLILLAEDNQTNREVVLEQLGMLGYAAEVAHDGVAALELWRSGRFSLLLTDCHMPNMDGFELAKAIRMAEPKGTRMPIIAVTASAMQGEAQRCRACGMDDYLAKPLRLKALSNLLGKWLLPGEHADKEGPADVTGHRVPVTGSDTLEVWDADALSDMVGDNPAVQRNLLGKYVSNAAQQVAAIEAALSAGDTANMAELAHKLKSGSLTVGAQRLGVLCSELEKAGRMHDALACDTLVARVRAAFLAVDTRIKDHLASELLVK